MTITPEQLAEMCRMADRALAWCIRRDPAADPAHRWRIRWAALTHEPRRDHYPADPQAELMDPQEAAKLRAEVERLRASEVRLAHAVEDALEHVNGDPTIAERTPDFMRESWQRALRLRAGPALASPEESYAILAAEKMESIRVAGLSACIWTICPDLTNVQIADICRAVLAAGFIPIPPAGPLPLAAWRALPGNSEVKVGVVDTATGDVTPRAGCSPEPVVHGGPDIWATRCIESCGMAECQMPPGHDGPHRFGDFTWGGQP